MFVTGAGDGSGRLFIVEQAGRIRIVKDGELLPEPFLDITDRVESGGERGLLGLAFHPEYAENGFLYVNYTHRPASMLLTRIARFSVSGNPDQSDAASEQVVLEFAQDFNNHNGGMIAFGPNDGFLYIATGDGGSANDPNQNAQNLNSFLGKILRLDVDGGSPYAVPAANPFIGTPGALPEIWAYGLRNPWRFSFDRLTGDVYIGDVGQAEREEIDYQPGASVGGENYGWRIFEGSRCNTPIAMEGECDALSPSAVFPIHEYTHDDGIAVTGGYAYRGAWLPELEGVYFFADFGSARVWSFSVMDGAASGLQEWTDVLNPDGARLTAISSFGEDDAGELYLASLGGKIFRLEPAHSADSTPDFMVSLSELLRVIQFYNSQALHCDGASEDGYAPGVGSTDCAHHDSDYNPPDWRISLSELLRLIQLYNVGSYRFCPELTTEDGFCTGVE